MRAMLKKVPGLILLYKLLKSAKFYFISKFFRYFMVRYSLFKLEKWERFDLANQNALPFIDRHQWVNKCRDIIKDTGHRHNDFKKIVLAMEAFYTNHVECLKDFETPPKADEVVLLVTVKNDYSRLDHFVSHYRKLGVSHFAFIDNGSVDGTVEKIMSYGDSACFRAHDVYNSSRKTGWFNRVAGYYGMSRWYVVVDSDELFAYPEMDRFSIPQYLSLLDERNIEFIRAVLIDVYPDGYLMDKAKTDQEYLESCVYFDAASSIKELKGKKSLRNRLFLLDQLGEAPSPYKPALLRFKNCFLVSSHVVFPRKVNDVNIGAICLHYKFLPSDREKYIKIAQEGNYYKGSWAYKAVNEKIADTPDINPISKDSVHFDSKESWSSLPFVKNFVSDWNKPFVTGKYERIGYESLIRKVLNPSAKQSKKFFESAFLVGLIQEYVFMDGESIKKLVRLGTRSTLSNFDLIQAYEKQREFSLYVFDRSATIDGRVLATEATTEEQSHYHFYGNVETPFIAETLAGETGSFDLLILDELNAHPSTMIDLLYAFPFLRNEGIVVLPDASTPEDGFGRAFIATAQKDNVYNVVKLDKVLCPSYRTGMSIIQIPTDRQAFLNTILEVARTRFCAHPLAQDDFKLGIVESDIHALKAFMENHYADDFTNSVYKALIENYQEYRKNNIFYRSLLS